jgi:cell division protein FtsB
MKYKKKNISVQMVIVIGLMMVSGMFVKYASEVYKDYKVNLKIDTLKNDIVRLEEENSMLIDDISYYNTPEYREIVAKDELGMRKPGELVFAIRSEETLSQKQVSYDYEQDISLPVHIKWWNLFMKHD